MLKKRIIPCLDIKDGRTVKGVQFRSLIDAGDPVEMANAYMEEGADELVFLDISASIESRKLLIDLVGKIAEKINIPFTVGGGINSPELVFEILKNGADKISINSAALKDYNLIERIAYKFGSQCVVVAVDASFDESINDWVVYSHGGSRRTNYKLEKWVEIVQEQGGGELLITSIDHDGTNNGFAVEMYKSLKGKIKIPLIASGGAGGQTHFKEIFDLPIIDAALAAGVFHFDKIRIPDLKQYLMTENIPIRWTEYHLQTMC